MQKNTTYVIIGAASELSDFKNYLVIAGSIIGASVTKFTEYHPYYNAAVLEIQFPNKEWAATVSVVRDLIKEHAPNSDMKFSTQFFEEGTIRKCRSVEVYDLGGETFKEYRVAFSPPYEQKNSDVALFIELVQQASNGETPCYISDDDLKDSFADILPIEITRVPDAIDWITEEATKSGGFLDIVEVSYVNA